MREHPSRCGQRRTLPRPRGREPYKTFVTVPRPRTAVPPHGGQTGGQEASAPRARAVGRCPASGTCCTTRVASLHVHVGGALVPRRRGRVVAEHPRSLYDVGPRAVCVFALRGGVRFRCAMGPPDSLRYTWFDCACGPGRRPRSARGRRFYGVGDVGEVPAERKNGIRHRGGIIEDTGEGVGRGRGSVTSSHTSPTAARPY